MTFFFARGRSSTNLPPGFFHPLSHPTLPYSQALTLTPLSLLPPLSVLATTRQRAGTTRSRLAVSDKAATPRRSPSQWPLPQDISVGELQYEPRKVFFFFFFFFVCLFVCSFVPFFLFFSNFPPSRPPNS